MLLISNESQEMIYKNQECKNPMQLVSTLHLHIEKTHKDYKRLDIISYKSVSEKDYIKNHQRTS